MDTVQTMPPIKELVNSKMSARHWLQYYINIWTRNVVAQCIDVGVDRAKKAINPEEEVEQDGMRGTYIPVKERLELRKQKLGDWKEILDSAQKLMLLSDEELEKLWSPEALAIDPDMVKKDEPKTVEPTPPPTPPTPPQPITKK